MFSQESFWENMKHKSMPRLALPCIYFAMSSFSNAYHVPFMSGTPLLVASKCDRASQVLFDALQRLTDPDGAPLLTDVIEGEILRGTRGVFACPFYVWLQEESLLKLNEADKRFIERISQHDTSQTPPSVSDIVFLSRHTAASGKPSLTVHPIGVPWLTESGTVELGGKPGRASPPSFRIGALYRSLMAATKESPLSEEFEVTLEATHHGPHVDVPACFVEIGSTEEEWGRTDVGDLWATVLENHFRAGDNFKGAATTAVVLIGGGHYCPRMGDMAKIGDEVVVGHVLAQYTLKDQLEENITPDNAVMGGWRQVILEAIAATKKTFPTQRLICVVDKKWKSTMRAQITGFLDEQGIAWTHKLTKSDILVLEDISA